jgi:acetyl esterase/lipase
MINEKTLHECYAVVKYAKEHAAELGIAPDNIAVGGHSAVGNLTAAICLLEAERNALGIKCIILDYPPLDRDTEEKLRSFVKEAYSTLIAMRHCLRGLPGPLGKNIRERKCIFFFRAEFF